VNKSGKLLLHIREKKKLLVGEIP